MENNKWDIKKIVIYLIATVFITYGLGAIMLFSNPKVFNWEKNSYSINDEKSASINGISRISVNVSSSHVNITSGEGSEVKAHYYGNVTTSGSLAKPELECYTSGDTLYVNVKSKSTIFFGFFSSDVKLDVTVPTGFSQELAVNSSSGSININSLKLSKLKIELSSGSTNIKQVAADDFNYDCSSGSLNAENLTTKTSKINASSGSERLTGFTGDFRASTSSGSVRVEYADFDNNINIDSSSGGVTVKLPGSSSFNLDASASSGGIHSSFPITVTGDNNRHSLRGTVGNDKNKISIHTSSGSINIEK